MGLHGAFAAMLTVATVVSAASSRLDIIDLPTGFFPEGITLAEEWTVYVGSLADGTHIERATYHWHNARDSQKTYRYSKQCPIPDKCY